MLNLQVRTPGGAMPQGLKKIFFTCHPADFEKAFAKIAADLHKICNCAIYYTENPNETISAEDYRLLIRPMNILVIPVTYKLLCEPNRALDADFRYAIREHIPVLPLMLETGLNTLYSLPRNFGKLQYLDPNTQDKTGLSYTEKLEKYLSSTLTDAKTTALVREEFDAYIFLSYRKKDRAHADTLMRMIHKNPRLRDVAIWYDEYLTPGEDFDKNILKYLDNSDLFALLVTKNLPEKTDEGTDNYVVLYEYPEAKKAGKKIFPVEAETPDREKLRRSFRDLPPCVETSNADRFYAQLLAALGPIAKRENDEDPVHLFLIGIAYLEGIDVETDRAYGVELITKAAQAGLPEAMSELRDMYVEGYGVDLNYEKALFWAQRHADACMEIYGENNEKTLSALHILAFDLFNLGGIERFEKALKLEERVYRVRQMLSGVSHDETLMSLNNLALYYSELGESKKALQLMEKACALRIKKSGEEHEDTLMVLSNLATLLFTLGDYKKSLELFEKVCNIYRRTLGTENPDTLLALSNLSMTYTSVGEYDKALELQKKVYALYCEVLGEEHPNTLMSLGNLALTYYARGSYKEAMELLKKVIDSDRRVLGPEHPNTLTARNNLAMTYYACGEYEKTLALQKDLYEQSCRVLGPEHSNTLTMLSNLALTHHKSGNYKKAMELQKQAYALSCKVHGTEHPDTILALNNMALTLYSSGRFPEALELQDKVYKLYCKTMGEFHPNALMARNNMALTLQGEGHYPEALALFESVWQASCKTLGEEHPYSLIMLGNFAMTYYSSEDYEKALPLQEKAYELTCRTLGEEHPDAVLAMHNMALTLYALGNNRKALRLQEKVYEMDLKIFGKDHPNTLLALNNIALTLNALEEQTKAAELLEYVCAKLCETLGADHPETIKAFGNLGGVYRELGKFKEAREQFENAYRSSLCCKAYGEKHSVSLSALVNLAEMYKELDDPKTSLSLFEKAFALSNEMFGKDYLITLVCASFIAQILQSFGRVGEALFYCGMIYDSNVPLPEYVLVDTAALFEKNGFPKKAAVLRHRSANQ